MTDRAVEVLLVEDNEDDVDLTMHAFAVSHMANQVHVVRDGAEALEFLFTTGRYSERSDHNLPRVVLLDLKLPLVDGVEVLREIRGDPRTQYVPVVVLTSSREENDMVETYQLGVNSFIVKPVDFDQFTEATRTIGMYWLLINEPLLPVARDG